MLKIKKQLKREKSRKRWIIIISLFVMMLMPYMVAVLNDEGLFNGWEVYFAFSYSGIVDLLLLINIFKLISEDKFDLYLAGDKVKIKPGLFKNTFSIPIDRIIYVDVGEMAKGDFEVVFIIARGKRNKNLSEFGHSIVKYNPEYKRLYYYIKNQYPNDKFYYYAVKKAGVRKYYYLYSIYKKAYKADFSERAIEYIKRFMEEYNLA